MSRGRTFLVAIAGAVGLAFGATSIAVAMAQDPNISRMPLRATVAVPALPDDATVTTAPEILRQAGLTPGTFRCDRSSGRPGAIIGRVTEFFPVSGTAVPLGTKVDMVTVQPSRCVFRMSRPPPHPQFPPEQPPPPPPPPPPAPETKVCADGSVIPTTSNCPRLAHPRSHSIRVIHGPTATATAPPITMPATDSGPDDPTDIEPPAEGPPEASPDAAPAPDAEKGRGAFVDPGDMEVNNWHRLEFVVGRTDAALTEESEDQELTRSKAIFVAPMMRVTLLPDPDFEIRAQSPAVQDTGADRAASWEWSVKPLNGGDHALLARVEVLEKQADGTLRPAETYTRRLAVNVRVGTWQGFLNALKGAASFGDVLATLFGSWGKSLTALTALIAAAVALWAAIRNLRKPKE